MCAGLAGEGDLPDAALGGVGQGLEDVLGEAGVLDDDLDGILNNRSYNITYIILGLGDVLGDAGVLDDDLDGILNNISYNIIFYI